MRLHFDREKIIKNLLLAGGLLTLIDAFASVFMQNSAAEASASPAESIEHVRSLMAAGASMTQVSQAASDLGLLLSLDSDLYPPTYSVSYIARSPATCEQSVGKLINKAEKVFVASTRIVIPAEIELACEQATRQRVDVSFVFKD